MNNSTYLKSILFLIFMIGASVGEGQQSITWQRLYDTPYQMDDYAFKIISADSGNFYIIGRATKPTSPYYGVANILKIDPYGKPIWHSIFDSVFQFPNSGALTPDGGCVTVGSGGSRFLKVDRNGSFVWYKSYNTLPVQLWDVIRTEDYGYIACGYVNSIRKDGYVIKIDSVGNFLWDKIFYANNWIYLSSIISGIDSGYIVAGVSSEFQPSRAVVYNLNLQGKVDIWKTYQNVEGTVIRRINSNYLLAGAAVNSNNFILYLNKNLDSNKIIFFPSPGKANYLMDISVVTKNRIAIASEIFGSFTRNYSNIMISDTLGNVLRNKNFYPFDSLGFVKLMSILSTVNGDIISAGYSDYYGFDNNDNYIAIRTDSLLNAPPLGIAEQNEFIPTNFYISQVYPNPFNPIATIEFFSTKTSMIAIEIFDTRGRKVTNLYRSQTNQGIHKVSWDASSYASGIYYVAMSVNSTFVSSRKIVLLK